MVRVSTRRFVEDRGPVYVRNTHDMRLSWPDLTTSKGHTLDLEPGAEAMLLADPGEVPHLSVRPVSPTPEVHDQ